MRACRIRTVDDGGALLGARAPGRLECLTRTCEDALHAGRVNDLRAAHACGRTRFSCLAGWLAGDPQGEWHERAIGGCIVVCRVMGRAVSAAILAWLA